MCIQNVSLTALLEKISTHVVILKPLPMVYHFTQTPLVRDSINSKASFIVLSDSLHLACVAVCFVEAFWSGTTTFSSSQGIQHHQLRKLNSI